MFLSPVLNPLFIGIVAGVGGSLGKVTSYFLGRGGYFLTGEKSRKNMEIIRGLTEKYGDIIIFIFAATPLPDDIYIVPAGLMKFPFWRFLLANTAGKIVLATAVAYLSRTYFDLAAQFLGGDSFIVILAAIILTILITLWMLRADWGAYLDVYRSEGLKGIVRHLPGLIMPRRKRG